MKGPMQMSVEAKGDFLGICFVHFKTSFLTGLELTK